LHAPYPFHLATGQWPVVAIPHTGGYNRSASNFRNLFSLDDPIALNVETPMIAKPRLTNRAATRTTDGRRNQLVTLAAAVVIFSVAANCTDFCRADIVAVPNNANIFGAGHTGPAATPFPGGTSPGVGPSGGTAPPTVPVSAGTILTFSATGSIDFGGGPGPAGPDGYATSAYEFASYNGISGYFADRGGAVLSAYSPAPWNRPIQRPPN
jgi:hypothetical protein